MCGSFQQSVNTECGIVSYQITNKQTSSHLRVFPGFTSPRDLFSGVV